MKLADFSRRDASHDALQNNTLQRVTKHPRVLIPLIFGSIALHFGLLWALAQFPAPPEKAPETFTEIQLHDFPAPPKPVSKPQVARVAQPKTRPRLANVPRAPRRIERVQPVRRVQLPRPRVLIVRAPRPLIRPLRREVVPKAPLVRSTRVVSKTGLVAKKPVVPVPRRAAVPTAAPLAPNPAPQPKRPPDTIFPRPQNPAPPAKTEADKPSPLPNAGEGQGKGKGSGSGKGSGTGSGQGSGEGSGQGAGNGSGQGSGRGSGSGSGQGSGAGEGSGSGQGKGQGSGQGGGSGSGQGAGNGSGSGDGSGSGGGGGGGGGGGNGGGGPFGLGGGMGEGPRHIVYVLDISTSMEPRIGRAKQELREALGGLQAGESFNIVAFYGKFRLFNQKLVDATPRNIARGLTFIDSLRLSGGTNLERAFEKTFAARGVNVVVVITDGVPTYGLGSPDFSSDNPDMGANFGQLARRVRELNRSGARIYTVGLIGKNPDGTDDSFEAGGLLQRIATESGGTFKTVRIDAVPQADFP